VEQAADGSGGRLALYTFAANCTALITTADGIVWQGVWRAGAGSDVHYYFVSVDPRATSSYFGGQFPMRERMVTIPWTHIDRNLVMPHRVLQRIALSSSLPPTPTPEASTFNEVAHGTGIG
jgi:hypothetical protein